MWQIDKLTSRCQDRSYHLDAAKQQHVQYYTKSRCVAGSLSAYARDGISAFPHSLRYSHGCREDQRCIVAECSTSTVHNKRQRRSFDASAMVGSKVEATGVHTKQVSLSLGYGDAPEPMKLSNDALLPWHESRLAFSSVARTAQAEGKEAATVR